jgi:large subunit ribosomal protein L29
MKPAKLRDMTVDELNLQERQLVEQIFKLRFQIAASQVENPAQLHTLRKDLARVKTIRHQKLAGATKGNE